MSIPKDIILFSTADWDNPFWTNKQHMAAGLAVRGYRILYIESLGLRKSTSSSRDLSRILKRLWKGVKGLRKVQKNIWVFSPIVIPKHENPRISRLNNKILSSYICRYIRHLRFKNPILWTYNPIVVGMLDRLKTSMLIYHCVDDLSSAPGISAHTIRKAEEKLVRIADIVFTTSPKLQKTCTALNPDNTYFFPNVADFKHFSKAGEPGPIPEDLMKIPRPRIGFIGAISDYKIDSDLISYTAKYRSDWHWVLIGKIGEGQPDTSIDKLKLSNVHFLGPKRYEILPDYLRGFDVAVIPARLNDYTSSMFPMKFFEYLSAGKPVVATNLPALQGYAGACILAGSSENFISAIQDVLAGKVPDKAFCLDLAQKHTWDWRTTEMLKLIFSRWELKNHH